jgi:hypothetical protein
MKTLFALSLMLVAQSSFACMGGRVELNGGNVVLTADRVTSGSKEESTIDLYEGQDTVTYDRKGEGFVTVKVVALKKDNGGVIDAYFEIKTEKKGSTSTKTIKVESNYRGNGVRTRSIEILPEADETYGC